MHSCFWRTWLWNRSRFCWWVMLIWWEHCNGLLETFCVGSKQLPIFSMCSWENQHKQNIKKTIPHHIWTCCCKCRSCGYYKHWNQLESMLKFPIAIIGLQHHSYKQQNPHETTNISPKFPIAIIGLQHHSYKQQNPHETNKHITTANMIRLLLWRCL